MKTPKIVSALRQVEDDIVSETACEKNIKNAKKKSANLLLLIKNYVILIIIYN